MKNIKRVFSVVTLMLVSHAVWSFSAGFESSNPITIMNFIQGNSALVYLSAFFGLGILLAFTPCVLPMVPILSGIIVGQNSLSTSKALRLSLSYVFGMAITYAVAGMLAGLMGSTIQTLMQRPIVIVIFSLIFISMALSMFGLFELRLSAKINLKLNTFSQKSSGHSFVSVALMGVISTLVVSPCVTAPLIGVLTYIGQNGQVFMGGLILFVMALGMGVPLILVGAGYGSFLPKTGSWMIKIKQLFGVIMLAIAIWMLGRILPELVVNLLWAALIIISSISLGSLKSQPTKLSRLFQGLGIGAIMLGGIILYVTVSAVIKQTSGYAHSSHAPFIKVHTLQALEQKLAFAKKEHKAVFIEFYATWCSDCQDMEAKVFNRPEIAKAMTGLLNLKVDISESDPEVNKIKKVFAIYGTPTMLFFDSKGQQLKQLSAVGYINAKSLLDLFKQVTNLS